jgi:hypothetical protein
MRRNRRWAPGALLVTLSLLGAPAIAGKRPAPTAPTVAPPVANDEARPAAPSPSHVWIPGHWGWKHNQYYWIHGEWSAPPTPEQVWLEGKWEKDVSGGSFSYRPGQWAPPGTPVPPPQGAVLADRAPPPPRAESPSPPPFPTSVWMGGFYQWQAGRYRWVRGHWGPARVGYRWEPTNWVPEGKKWRRVAGHWQRT